mmetsp:Transcript_15944/g.42960  ORF Transcript_15944/g.42960 Transcript_15944/m.42960 type:complete len:106 (+) Transcript_15944:89-406(+)|eukprot:CAMPEP_0185162872 /NCGR_PEP_ID=MMETSP1139-20130426/7140_1 /TAXON_ID=298111 /ORGANISM="Pavlova sp., Strain CCMP459" /LENGTH=105 /DNA_ID=CAMNT_0027728213 /DNA_START=29 /DNA_END=346 /DNA_ORIENTATION=+
MATTDIDNFLRARDNKPPQFEIAPNVTLSWDDTKVVAVRDQSPAHQSAQQQSSAKPASGVVHLKDLRPADETKRSKSTWLARFARPMRTKQHDLRPSLGRRRISA